MLWDEGFGGGVLGRGESVCGAIVTSGFDLSAVVTESFKVGDVLGNSVLKSIVVGALVTNVGTILNSSVLPENIY